MNRELKWVILIAAAVVAAFIGMALSQYVMANASSGGSLIFTLAMLGIVGGILYWLLSGNKKVVMADAGATTAALAMRPSEGKAAIYIYRKGFVGMLQGFNFAIEGVASGQAKGNQFLHAEVAPGSYRITAKAKGNGGETEVSVAAGEVAVLRVELEPGLVTGKIVFDRVANPAMAKADLASIKMVSWDG
ncbi:MAG: DUF2846 domain-containing protein [Novosphingobium sp.]